jgi:Porin PorA
MHRDAGTVLIGIATFLIVMAVALPTYIVGHVAEFPLSVNETVTLTGNGSSYFSAARDTEVTGADIRATDTLTADPTAGSSSVAVWNEFSYTYDTTHRELVRITTRTFAFDRRTARLTSCRCANVDGNSAISQTGLAGPVFPVGAAPETYDVFDTTLNRPEPFGYDGTAAVGGIRTYRFAENVPATRLGYSPLSSTQPEYATIHRICWVDPVTGLVLSVREYQRLFLEDPATGAQTTVLYSADLQATPASVRAMVKADSTERSKLALVGTALPITLGIAGAVALVAGILLARPARRGGAAASGSTPPGPAAGAAAAPGPSAAPSEPDVRSAPG